jgi:aryl-alcohol dehydrogenase-like predicted oxidoreductase
MQHRTFGCSGLRLSRAIIGTMTFGEQGSSVSRAVRRLGEFRRILDRCLEAGGTTERESVA